MPAPAIPLQLSRTSLETMAKQKSARAGIALAFPPNIPYGGASVSKSTSTRDGGQQAPDGALDYALDVVSAMGEAGLTAVPIKPSTEMLTAGARAGEVSVETAWKIYQSMITAAD